MRNNVSLWDAVIGKRWFWLTRAGRGVAACTLGVGVLAVVALFGIQAVDYIPDNAIVYVDGSKSYYSPPVIWEDTRVFHVATAISEVRVHGYQHVSRQPRTEKEWAEVALEFEFAWVCNRDKTWTEFRPSDGICVVPIKKGDIKEKVDYSPDRDSVEAGGFYGEGGSLLFQLLGLNESRWTADGTWRW